MYLPFGCLRALGLSDPAALPNERILDLALSPTGSLLALATTHRLAVWSGGKNHVPLGSISAHLGVLKGGCCVLWKKVRQKELPLYYVTYSCLPVFCS
jgi:hypothetical protein